MKLTGKKLLLLLLYSPINGETINVPITGRTRFMKMVFLFEKEVLPDFKRDRTFEEIRFPEFFGWKYGPFSKDLLNDLEFLINQQYIKVEISTSAPISAELDEFNYWIEDLDEFESREYDEEIFKLDNKGISKAAEIWSNLSENQKKLLVEFKRVLNRAPLDRILDYVYKKYYKEGYIDKSLIREKYLS
jgi:uncharacterized protein YwgA